MKKVGEKTANAGGFHFYGESEKTSLHTRLNRKEVIETKKKQVAASGRGVAYGGEKALRKVTR